MAAAVRLEIADAVRDMEAALAGRKLVWVKRGLWARWVGPATLDDKWDRGSPSP